MVSGGQPPQDNTLIAPARLSGNPVSDLLSLQRWNAVLYDFLVKRNQPLSGGPTTSRPASPTLGLNYFDTTLNKPAWWNGSSWVDATGAHV